jgi:phosphopantetheinyl transferase
MMDQALRNSGACGHVAANSDVFASAGPLDFSETVLVDWARDENGAKPELIGRMLERVNWGMFSSLKLEQTDLGQPILMLDGKPGPHVSFSRDERGRIFAAVCLKSPVGIDAAHPKEFSGAYPFDRAFSREELGFALLITDGLTDAAALLWSFKEAAVKARGTGFHRIDPRNVFVDSPQRQGDGFSALVHTDVILRAWACRRDDQFVALSLDNPISYPLYS